MRFYSIVNIETLDTKEINKVFFNEREATNFVRMLNMKSVDGRQYATRSFEYKLTKEEIEKYGIASRKLNKKSLSN